MANVEVLLPLAMTLLDEGDLDFATLLSCLTSGPAACFGLEAGSLAVGSFADFILFDSTARWHWEYSKRKTKGHNSPYFGDKFIGQVTATYISGQRIYQLS
jgi:dihydroorotase